MALHQNDSETTESIKEAKATCDKAAREAKATCNKDVGGAKATGAQSHMRGQNPLLYDHQGNRGLGSLPG